MHKPLTLLLAFLCPFLSYSQKTDTLVLFYNSDKYDISRLDQKKIDSFLSKGWDRFQVNGYTDETDSEEYNIDLSRKRSDAVYQFMVGRKIPPAMIMTRQFGESMPFADNDSEDGRSLNRRTVIVGYYFPRPKLKPVTNPMLPVTRTLDNGLIITYRPGAMPGDMAANFELGSGMNFQFISNTMQMRQNNLYNNTTNGEILSSVMILCGSRLNPCKLDSAVLVRVPIPNNTNCPIEKVKFFNAVAEKGKRIWQEESKSFYPEIINGQKYIRIWIDNFCQCINFDFKIDPDCYDVDSTRVLYANADIRSLSTELQGMNSVYIPKKIGDNTYHILYMKDGLDKALMTFSLYNGKRRVRGFRNQLLTSFNYDETARAYVLEAGTIQLQFPRVKVYDVAIKVNGDKYKVVPDEDLYEFRYLRRKTEKILVDFSIVDAKGRVTYFKNQPLESFPENEKGVRVIDRKFIRVLKQMGTLAKR